MDQRQRRNSGSNGRSVVRRRGWLALGAIVFVIAVLAVGAYRSWMPPTADGTAQDVLLRPGESTRALAADLKQRGLIHSPLLFRVYLAWSGLGPRLEAGHYRFNRGETTAFIAQHMAAGDVVVNTVRVTIPEGFTVLQIADRLATAGICSQAAFLNAAQHDQVPQPMASWVPADARVKYRLEGYLFPDTYGFEKGETAHQVLQEMLHDFLAHVDGPVQTAMAQKHLTMLQVITVASLIEREAKVAAERPVISSVIYNRLRIGMPLQMDASIQYILGHQNIVTNQDLQVDDPYNTYLHPGLPPGPIANPGLASIQAAIQPARTQYLYYVVKNDRSGTDYFSSTYAQFLRDKSTSEANLQKYGH